MRLWFVITFVFLGSFNKALALDCSDPQNIYAQKCLRQVSCSNVKDVEFGGGQYSNFETFSCSKLISMFEASEKEGNMKQRMESFIRKNEIKNRYIADCPKEKSEARKKCVLGVYKILDKYEADRAAFVAALSFKVAVYDSIFHTNRKDFLGDSSCKKPSSLKSPRDYKYNKSEYQSDCEMIGLNSPACYLKLGTQVQYPSSAKSYFEDRQVCQKFIEANTKVDNEPFSSGLKKDPYASDAPTAASSHTPDCSNFDPNNLKAFQANPKNLDTTLYCLESPSSGQGGKLKSSGAPVRTGR